MDNLLNLAPCGFLSFRDDGTIVRANQTLKDLLGFDTGLEGKSINSILTVASQIFYNTHFFPLIRLHGKADEIFFSLMDCKKNSIPVFVNAVRRTEDDSYINHCVFMPVHQRQRYEEEILKAKKVAEDALRRNEELILLTGKLEEHKQELDKQYNRLLSINHNLLQFSKIISHDLQEPIRKIQIFSSILASQTAGQLNTQSKKALERIDASTEKLRQLTKGLQEFVKVDIEKNFASIDLNTTLAEAREKVTTDNHFNDLDLISEPLPVIDGYPEQLQLLFYHLIDNSIKYRNDSKRLAIHVHSTFLQENSYRVTEDKYRYTDHVKIIYSDNGIGFDNKYKEYVFDMLTKVDPHAKGLGIGLALCKKIVDNHFGTMHVSSTPGKGTKFNILLPVRIG